MACVGLIPFYAPLVGLAALVVTKFSNPPMLVASEVAPFGMTLERRIG